MILSCSLFVGQSKFHWGCRIQAKKHGGAEQNWQAKVLVFKSKGSCQVVFYVCGMTLLHMVNWVPA